MYVVIFASEEDDDSAAAAISFYARFYTHTRFAERITHKTISTLVCMYIYIHTHLTVRQVAVEGWLSKV